MHILKIVLYYLYVWVLHLQKEAEFRMFIAITFLLVAILSAVAIFREVRRRNLFAVAFAGLSFLVFGFFSVATIVSIVLYGDGAP